VCDEEELLCLGYPKSPGRDTLLSMISVVADALEPSLAERGAATVFARLGGKVARSLRLESTRRVALETAVTAAKSAGAASFSVAGLDFPAGLNSVHPSWIRHVLGSESTAVAAALAARLESNGVAVGEGPWSETRPASLSPAALHEILWLLFGRLSDPDPGQSRFLSDGSSEELLPGGRSVLWHRLGGAVLWRALCERGAAEVGRSLHGAERVMKARAMATVGAPWAQVVEKYAAVPLDGPARDRSRLVIARASAMATRQDAQCDDLGRPPAELRLAFVGLCAARMDLSAAGPAALRTIALRLPHMVGRCLLESGTYG